MSGTPEPTRTISPRRQSLDILRAVAVLLVLGRHLPNWPDSTPYYVHAVLTIWKRVGWIGVDLFFVLSGFLVSGLLFREYLNQGNVRLSRFLVRRGLKIYPAFYAFLLVTLVLRWHDDLWPPTAKIASELLFVQSYFSGLWNHTWTLAVEEHFYLLIGVLIAYFASRGSGRPFAFLLWLFPAVAVCALVARIITAASAPYSHETHLFPTHLRIDSLLFGVFLSYMYHFQRPSLDAFLARYRVVLIAFASLFVLTPLLFPLGDGMFMHTVGFTLLYLAFGVILLLMLDYSPGRSGRWVFIPAALASIGVYSYSIYLWHMPVLKYGPRTIAYVSNVPKNYWFAVAIYFVGSVCVGIAMSKIVEMPVLALRDRWFPSRSGKRGTRRPKDDETSGTTERS